MTASTPPLVLVTGATDGIGRETALTLARRGARVLLHGRSGDRLARVHAELAAVAGGPHPEPARADLASLADVRALAADLDARGLRPTVLVNNAGVFMNERVLTRDGFEMTAAVNHLAPFLLTHLLLATPGAALARIVNVSSVAHGRGRVDDPDDPGLVARPFDGYGHYAASKLANVLFTVALAPRVADRGVTVNALHPGVVSTKLLLEGFNMRGGDSLAEGAATSVTLALAPDLADVTGRYFSGGQLARTNRAADDDALVERFYLASAKAVGVEPLPKP
ncbi:MAG: SDR family NAD(P)-dependent oxidoreductase [Deltaproteobacteria bacterium]|nr:SDR family NAD(P)-dependent oxidoreductase [Deltaproteobacteria bacterium]